MKLVTKILLTIVLAVVAVSILVWQFWPKSNSSAPAVTNPTKTVPVSNSDPYNITNVQPQSNYTVNIINAKLTIGDQTINRYVYSDSNNTAYPAGQPLVLAAGKPVTIKVNNKSGTTTNVHWHGLTVPSDMDGALDKINNGSSKTFSYTPTETGTYWYHSHYRPVEEQVGDGMFAPLIIKTAADSKYNLDEVLLLSDLTSGSGGMMGSNSVEDLINGQSGSSIRTLTLSGGQIAQLRFIDASSDNTKTVNFPFDVRVTHKDGYALSAPYTTRSLTIYPGQRIDVEVALTGSDNQTYQITDGSATIPLNYTGNSASSAKSPFVSAKSTPVSQNLLTKTPDFTLNLAGGMGGWTINGQVFPNLPTMKVKVGQTYKVRFVSPDGMMSYDHPMHIHGAHFQVIAVNGQATNDDTWYDTYPMKAGTETDIAVKWDLPGVWVVHCHILNHEDNGMMASFTAS